MKGEFIKNRRLIICLKNKNLCNIEQYDTSNTHMNNNNTAVGPFFSHQ